MKKLSLLLMLVPMFLMAQLPVGTERKTVITDTNGNVISTPLVFSNQVKMAPAPTQTNHIIRLMDLTSATNSIIAVTNGLATMTFVSNHVSLATNDVVSVILPPLLGGLTNYTDSATNDVVSVIIPPLLGGLTNYVEAATNDVVVTILPTFISGTTNYANSIAVAATNYADSVTNGFVSSVTDYDLLTTTNLVVYNSYTNWGQNVFSNWTWNAGSGKVTYDSNADVLNFSGSDVVFGGNTKNFTVQGDAFIGGGGQNIWLYGVVTMTNQVDFGGMSPTNAADATELTGLVTLSQLQGATNGGINAVTVTNIAAYEAQIATNGAGFLASQNQIWLGTNIFNDKMIITNTAAGNGSYVHWVPDDNGGMRIVGTNALARGDFHTKFASGKGYIEILGPASLSYLSLVSDGTANLTGTAGVSLSADNTHSVVLNAPYVEQYGPNASMSVNANSGIANGQVITFYTDGVDDYPSIALKVGGVNTFMWVTNNRRLILENVTVTNQTVLLGETAVSNGTIYLNHDAVLTNEAVTLGQLQTEIESLGGFTWFGVTNQHPVLGASFGSFWPTLPGTEWTNTTALASGTNFLGSRMYTNAIPNNIVRSGQYIHTVYLLGTGGGAANSLYYSQLVAVNSLNTVTNVIATGSTIIPANALNVYDIKEFVNSDYSLPAGTWYLGEFRYGVRNGTATSISIVGGSSSHPTHLTGPSQDIAFGNVRTDASQTYNVGTTQKFSQFGSPEYTNTYTGTAVVIDAKQGNSQTIVLTNNPTITVSNLFRGENLTLTVAQDGTGGRVSTFATQTGTSLQWLGGFTPTNSAAASAIDVFGFIRRGNNYVGIGPTPVQTVFVTNISSLPKLIIANAAAQTITSGTITQVSATNCLYNTDTANTFWTWDTNNSYGVFKSNCWIKVSGGVPLVGTTITASEFWIGSTNAGAPSYMGYGIFPDLWYADAFGTADKYRLTFSQNMYVTNGHPFAFGIRTYGTGTLQIQSSLPEVMQILIEPIP